MAATRGFSAGGMAERIAFAVALLLIFWVIHLRATLRAIGAPGMVLAGGLVAALIWVMTDLGVLSLSSGAAMAWTGLVGLGVALGIGLSWSHVRRALSGQGDVDDVSD